MIDEKDKLDDIEELDEILEDEFPNDQTMTQTPISSEQVQPDQEDVQELELAPDSPNEVRESDGSNDSEIQADNDFSDNDAPPWSPVMNIDGVTYATGLFWQPLQNPDDPIPEIKESSEGTLEGADLFALRPGVASQYGLGLSDDGHKKGQISAAIAISEAFAEHQSSVGVFKVKEGWWYVAIRNDIIISDGDVLFLNEEDAQRAFFSMMAVPDWGIKVAPQEWGIEGTVEVDLNRLLKSSKQIKLQKIYGLRGAKLLAIIGIAAIIGLWLLVKIFLGIFDFSSKPEKPVFVPVKRKIAKKAVIPEVKPWEKIPDTASMLDNCWKNIYSLNLIPTPGWRNGSFTCSNDSISVNWSRMWGRIHWLDESFANKKINFLSKAFSADGENLVAIINNKKAELKLSPPTLGKKEMVKLINDLFQSIGQPITLADLTIKVANPNQPGTDRIYRAVKFGFTSKHDPSLWVDLLSKFSGLHLQYIKYDPENKTWGYEGQIYVL